MNAIENTMISIRVDNATIEIPKGTNLLQACLDNGIYIPNLCYLEGMEEPPSSCRMCFVDIEGVQQPVAACSLKVREPLVVRTDSDRVRKLQRANLKLLLSVHHVDCRNCPANNNCELRRLAKFLKTALNAKPLEHLLNRLEVDATHPRLDYHPYRCVLCGRCIAVCLQQNEQPVLAFARRGFDTIITSFGTAGEGAQSCASCSQCADICPVGALTLKPTFTRT